MEYKLDYKELHSMCTKVRNQSNEWVEQIGHIMNDVNAISRSPYVTGQGAFSFKQYFNAVHYNNLCILLRLIALHRDNCLAYEHDYLTNVSGDGKTHVETAEIKSIKEKLEMQRGINERLHNEIVSTMDSIRNIMTVSYPDEEKIHDARTKVSRLIDALNKAICTVERNHTANDFNTSRQMIESLKSVISANVSKGRSFDNFSYREYISSPEYAALVEANSMFHAEYTSKKDVYIHARESHDSLEAVYREEREERERTAILMRIGVIVVTSLVAVAGTAVLGPVAVPIIVGGINGMISSAANSAIDAYVEDGEIDKSDLKEIEYEGIKGAVIGTITGAVSSSVGVGLGRVTDNLLAGPLSSQNEVIRLGSGVVTGGVNNIVNGVAERGFEETLDQVADSIYKGEKISADSIIDNAFDSKKMSEDFVFGGLSGGLKESKRLDKEVNDGALNRQQLKDRGDNLYSYEKRIDNAKKYRKNIDIGEDQKELKREKIPYAERVLDNIEPLNREVDAGDIKDAMKTEYKVIDKILQGTDKASGTDQSTEGSIDNGEESK